MMRKVWLAVPILLSALVGRPLAASVLLPEETPSLDGVMKQTPAQDSPEPISIPDVPVAPTAPAQSSTKNVQPSAPSALDKIDPELMKELAGDSVKEQLPDEMKVLSSDDFSNLMTGHDSAELQEKLKKIVQSSSVGPALGVTGAVQITPGGTVGKKPPTQDDILTAKLLQSGRIGNEQKDSPLVENAKKVAIAARKIHERPPIYLSNKEMNPTDESTYKNPFLIGVMPDYVWGENDIKRLGDTFGFTREDIPKNCQIRLKIRMRTTEDDAPYQLYMFSGEQKTGSVNGDVLSLDVSPLAVCYPPQTQPQNGMVIFKHGDKQAIALEESHCDVPQQKNAQELFSPTSAGIRYLGNGKVSCGFK